MFAAELPLAAGLVQIVGSRARLRPEQRTFNKLISDIDRAKADLVAWRALADELFQRLEAEWLPALRAKDAATCELVIALDQMLSRPQTPALGRLQRQRLGTMMTEMLRAQYPGTDAERFDAIHRRHHGCTVAAWQQQQQRLAENFRREIFGERPPAADATPAPEPEAPRARRGDSGGELGDGKHAQQAREASQSLRDTYRRLASILHPDRETDEGERERKNALMQQANRAYEARDLLTLLSMQLEQERFDPSRLQSLPGERVKQYNQVLREQLSSLQGEIRSIIDALAEVVFPGMPLPPADLTRFRQGMRNNLIEVARHTARVQAVVAGLSDPARTRSARQAVLTLAAEFMETAGPSELEDALYAEMLDAIAASARRAPGRRRRR